MWRIVVRGPWFIFEVAVNAATDAEVAIRKGAITKRIVGSGVERSSI